jgi:hypothetical protein
METIEIWKPIFIDNEETNYQVSNFGYVKNNKNNKFIKPSLKSGYLCLSLSYDNYKRKSCKIHRLVAIAFIPNPENKETVNHIDHNKFNNNVDNLEWATTTEQNRHKRKCKKEIQEFVSSRAVWRIDKNTNEKIELYQTIKNASKWVFDNNLTGIKEFNNGNNIKTKISAVAQKKRNFAFGYKWEYDNSNEHIYENEIWKDIPKEIIDGIEGYKISSYGRVKNHKGRITTGSNHLSGYLWVSIAPKQYLLHRLVSKVFIPNPENKEQVNHIDGDKTNCKLENLEWNTNIENQIHKVRTGLLNIKKIIQYDLLMNKIKIFNSQLEASKELNISYSGINKCCLNKQHTAGGFIFKFAE